jgi:hypothetical protein
MKLNLKIFLLKQLASIGSQGVDSEEHYGNSLLLCLTALGGQDFMRTIIPVLGRLNQEDQEFKASLGYA